MNATAVALRGGSTRADFAWAGYSSGLTTYTTKQAFADGYLMMSGGAASTSVFTQNNYSFGLYPPAGVYTTTALAAIAEAADAIDAGNFHCMACPHARVRVNAHALARSPIRVCITRVITLLYTLVHHSLTQVHRTGRITSVAVTGLVRASPASRSAEARTNARMRRPLDIKQVRTSPLQPLPHPLTHPYHHPTQGRHLPRNGIVYRLSVRQCTRVSGVPLSPRAHVMICARMMRRTTGIAYRLRPLRQL